MGEMRRRLRPVASSRPGPQGSTRKPPFPHAPSDCYRVLDAAPPIGPRPCRVVLVFVRQRQSAALQGDQRRSVGHRAAPPPAKLGHCDGFGQQDRAHRLGGDAPRGELPASGSRGCGVNRPAEKSSREGNKSVMAQSVDPTLSRAAWRFIGTAIPFE
jgi:hypothetical protein